MPVVPREPQTDEEWQEAVDAANGLLMIDAAREYGLIRGGPKIDLDRCAEILERGAARQIRPRYRAIGRLIAELAKKGEEAADANAR